MTNQPGANFPRRMTRARAPKQRDVLLITAFLAPTLLFVLVYAYFPILSTLRYSLTSWDGISTGLRWVGLNNFTELFKDPYVLKAFFNNLLILAVSLFIQLPLAFGVAYAVFSLRNHRAEAYKIINFLPGILSLVMVGLMWRFIFDYQRGPVNLVLRGLGLSQFAQSWLGNVTTVFGAILVVVVWAYFGQHSIVHSAGLNSLSREVLEAASIDGAKGFSLVRLVVIPMTSEVLRVTIVMAIIGSFKYFDLVWIMTGGGPFHSSDVLATYMYHQAFLTNRFGYGAAISVLILLCALGGTLLQLLWQRSGKEGHTL